MINVDDYLQLIIDFTAMDDRLNIENPHPALGQWIATSRAFYGEEFRPLFYGQTLPRRAGKTRAINEFKELAKSLGYITFLDRTKQEFTLLVKGRKAILLASDIVPNKVYEAAGESLQGYGIDHKLYIRLYTPRH
jgi:hypothetical protein